MAAGLHLQEGGRDADAGRVAIARAAAAIVGHLRDGPEGLGRLCPRIPRPDVTDRLNAHPHFLGHTCSPAHGPVRIGALSTGLRGHRERSVRAHVFMMLLLF